MNIRCFSMTVAALIGLLAYPGPAYAGGVGGAAMKQAARSFERSASRAVAKTMTRVPAKTIPRAVARPLSGATQERAAILSNLRKDAAAHRLAPLQKAAKPRFVYRYTSRQTAALERRQGVPPLRHTTTKIGPGRPMSSARAQRTFGLPKPPEIREKLLIPKNTRYQITKVQGGIGRTKELFTKSPIPATGFRDQVHLK